MSDQNESLLLSLLFITNSCYVPASHPANTAIPTPITRARPGPSVPPEAYLWACPPGSERKNEMGQGCQCPPSH